MKNFTSQDLEALARAGTVSAEDLQALCADPQAFAEWTRLLRVRDLLDPAESAPEPSDPPPPMDVSLEELTHYRENGPLAPDRRAAVEHFLRLHFPEALRPETDVATEIEPGFGDTEIGPLS